MSKDFIKYLQRLNPKEREKLLLLVSKIEKLELDNLDIKKMSWFQDRFRARNGKFRIVFEVKNDIWIIYEINTRGDIY